MIRVFDIIISFLLIVILSPILILIGILIMIESKGGVFYLQERIGYNEKPFRLFKFRSMVTNADKSGFLTIGMNDSRITNVGYFIRKFKIDELPQLINVLIGDMSMVGPRPEVRKYVEFYTKEQLKVLSVRPGITDYASIVYVDENILLGSATDPEKIYIEEIMPHKILLNMKYIENQCLKEYFHIILLTLLKLLKN